MIKTVLLLFLLISNLSAEDRDFDGVEDFKDRCLDTSFSDTVDIYGCPEEYLYIGKVSLGLGYYTTQSLDSTLFNLNYNYNNTLVEVSNEYYQNSNFYSLAVGYRYLYKDMKLRLYGGINSEKNLLSHFSYDYMFNTFSLSLFAYFLQEYKPLYEAGISYNYKSFLLYGGYDTLQKATLSLSYFYDRFRVGLEYTHPFQTQDEREVYINLEVSFG
jgi:hypothetical protein